MATRRYEKYYSLTKGNTNTVRISVCYDLGDYRKKRGYYLSMGPCDYKRENGFIITEIIPSSGYRFLIKELKRDSQKAFDEAVKFAEENAKILFESWFPNLETNWKEI